MDIRLNNETWDIDVAAQDLDLTKASTAVAQHLSQRLKTFYQEWFLDRRIGVPYFQQVLVKAPDPVVLDSVFKAAIVSTPGVTELLSFNLYIDRGSRQLRLAFAVATSQNENIFFDEVLP